MSEYDFEGEVNDLCDENTSDAHCTELGAALRRAYAAGQASGGGSDLDRLVTLASTHRYWSSPQVPTTWQKEVLAECTQMLDALKAQVVEK